jgi:hypothetical protein
MIDDNDSQENAQRLALVSRNLAKYIAILLNIKPLPNTKSSFRLKGYEALQSIFLMPRFIFDEIKHMTQHV